MPSLRERIPDIPLLVAEFLRQFCARENKMLTVSGDVIKAFQHYHWPGNIRQLKNVIERAVVLAKGDIITLGELPDEFQSVKINHDIQTDGTLRSLEAQVVVNTLQHCRGNKSKAAKILGISRKALYKKLSDCKVE
jgi:two-component system response regulator HydG